MEDFTPQGYSSISRAEVLDRSYSNLILGQFAKFHALSYAFKDQKPLEFQEITKHLEVSRNNFQTVIESINLSILKENCIN